MSYAKAGLKTVFQRMDSSIIFITSALIILVGYFMLENLSTALEVFSFSFLSFGKMISLFFSTLFNINGLAAYSILPLITWVSIFGGLVISLLYTYIKIRGNLLKSSGAQSGIGLIFAILGIGCAACGTVLLQTILSIFGFGGLLSFFPYHGLEVGYFGLLLLIINTYTLSNRLGKPLTC